MKLAITATIAVCLPVSVFAEGDLPRFQPVEISPHVYAGGWEHFVGGGIAVFDCNGDTLPEVYAAGGVNAAQLFLNTSSGDVALSAETPDELSLTAVTGAYPLDIDSDGTMDLAVLRVGEDLLLRGTGDCRFEPVDDIGFSSGDQWTTAFSATWEEGEALPTLAFGTYIDRSDPDGPFEACDATQLFRPSGDAYVRPLALEPGYCALSILFSDWSRSGRADLRISNDRHYYVRGGQEQMWAMEPVPRLFTAEDHWQPYSIWGMGIASRDLSGDGYPEVYLTSMGDQKLQRFDPETGGPTWRDVTYEFGTTAHRPHVGDDGRPSTGWHAQFGDVTNNGRDDIFVSKGNVEQMPGLAMNDPNSLLMQSSDGHFIEVADTAGVATMDRSRGAALVDLNMDGLLDLVVVNRRADMEVFQNVTPDPGNWLMVSLRQTGPNTNAVGSFIEIRSANGLMTREITIGGGHVSGQATPEHFGLGGAETADLRVIWPDGTSGEWHTVSANQILTITR